VIVVAHAEGWRGADAPLSTGDIIHGVNHIPVESLDGLRATLGSITTRTPVVLQVERSGKFMFITYDVN